MTEHPARDSDAGRGAGGWVSARALRRSTRGPSRELVAVGLLAAATLAGLLAAEVAMATAPEPPPAETSVEAAGGSGAPTLPLTASLDQQPRPPTPLRIELAGHSTQIDHLSSDDGSLDTPVGSYSDCTGQAPLPYEEAELDTCLGTPYFIGHNPGVFTALARLAPGSVLTWRDHDGLAHRLRLLTRRQRDAGLPPLPPLPHATAQFQTCAVPDGSVDWVIDAAALN